MKKITVVGGGNAGCFTALYCGWYGRQSEYEIELVYNPEIPPERVGQATVIEPPGLLWAATGFNWYHNKIDASFKSGILYEGWGKLNDKIFHSFPADRMSMHFSPKKMQKSILDSGHFKVKESNVLDPDKIDSDYVFDCRGKPDNFDDYEDLINPINACILGKPNWDTTKDHWSRHIATPDGWAFVIPSKKGTIGYLKESQYPVFLIYDNSKGVYYRSDSKGDVRLREDNCRNGYPFCYGWENFGFYFINTLQSTTPYMDCFGKLGGKKVLDECGICGGLGPQYECKSNGLSYCSEAKYQIECLD